MGAIVIEAIRQAPFIKGAISFRGTDMDDRPNGQEVQEPFDGKLLPGNTRTLTPNFSLRANKFDWDQAYLPEEDLKRLVPQCGFYDDKGNLITEVNLYNDADPFMTRLSINLQNGKTVLDDGLPKNRIAVAFFMKDRRFKVIGDENPRGQSREEYLIGFQDAIEKQRVMASEAEMNIVLLLQEMSRKKMLKLCKIWDYKPPEALDDMKLKTYLYEKMKGSKQYMGKQTRAQWFLTYAKMNEQDLGYWDLFLDGRRARSIVKNSEDMYSFQGFALGRHEQESVDFLMQPGNQKLVNDLRAQIKSKKKGEYDLPPLNLSEGVDGTEQSNTPRT